MSLELCVLASGSGGNCTVVRTPRGTVLIDAGIGPRTATRRLDGTGASLRDVVAICLTHLDSDHFTRNWVETILSRGIQLFCHASRVEELLEIGGEELRPAVAGFEESFEPLDGLRMNPISLAHDQAGSHGFVIEGFGSRIGYATDLGRVTAELIEEFVDLDVLAIESNYDPQMQLESARPAFLKQRIMGGFGHLSNQQALAAVRRVLDRHEIAGTPLPSHVVLLHRSRQCNCPKLLRKLFMTDARLANRLTLAEQFHRSDWLRVGRLRPLVGEQLVLGWG